MNLISCLFCVLITLCVVLNINAAPPQPLQQSQPKIPVAPPIPIIPAENPATSNNNNVIAPVGDVANVASSSQQKDALPPPAITTTTVYKNYEKLDSFQQKFKNVKESPFTEVCDKLKERENAPCIIYYDVLMRFVDEVKIYNSTNSNELIENYKKYQLTQQQQTSVTKFCESFPEIIPNQSKFIETNETVIKTKKILKQSGGCTAICTKVDLGTLSLTINPICSMIAWGYTLLDKPDVLEPIKPSPQQQGEIKPPQPPPPSSNIDSEASKLKQQPEVPDQSKQPLVPQQKSSPSPAPPPQPKSSPIPDQTLINENKDKDTDLFDVDPSTGERDNDDDGINDAFDETNQQPPPQGNNNPILTDDDKSVGGGDKTLSQKNNQDQEKIDTAPDVIPEYGDGGGGDDDDEETKIIPKQQQPLNNNNNNFDDRKTDPFVTDTDSYFFHYFMFVMLVCVLGYVGYHNKTKILALVLEGRRNSGGRGGSGGSSGYGRKKHTAAYRKLDSNLEEAITSSTVASSNRQIIY